MSLVDVSNLTVAFSGERTVHAVNGVDFSLNRGEVTARFVDAVFSRCDALATPTLPMAAAKIAETDVGGGPDMLRVLGGFT